MTPFAAFLGVPLTQNKEKLENRELSCHSFSEIRRNSEKVWHETHQYLKKLSKIKEPSLKFKNEKRFPLRPRKIHTGQKTGLKISCDSPFKRLNLLCLSDLRYSALTVRCTLRDTYCTLTFRSLSILQSQFSKHGFVRLSYGAKSSTDCRIPELMKFWRVILRR